MVGEPVSQARARQLRPHAASPRLAARGGSGQLDFARLSTPSPQQILRNARSARRRTFLAWGSDMRNDLRERRMRYRASDPEKWSL